MNRTLALFISLSIFLCTACDPSGIIVRSVSGESIVGSGTIIRENRDLADFDSVDVRGSMDVEIARGEKPSCVVEADDNIVAHVKTEVRDGELVIRIDRGFSFNKSVNVYVEIPELSGITLSGSGDINFIDVTKEKMNILIDGSGNITGVGEVETLTAEINGSGDMDLFKLYSENAAVEINGSGDVEVQANNSLECKINGSGDITYSGSPASVKKKVNGSGDIVEKE